jgi:V8-like Glu-specific endopeptidase
MATGWLIEKDLLVTAGHCAYDWSHKYGRLTHVKAYVGYSGKESVKDTSMVELRMGIRVASTESWLSKGDTQPNGDVSFIRLNKPFTGVTPIKYIPTPSTGSNVSIGVVGYPGDLMKRTTQEKGAVSVHRFIVQH